MGGYPGGSMYLRSDLSNSLVYIGLGRDDGYFQDYPWDGSIDGDQQIVRG